MADPVKLPVIRTDREHATCTTVAVTLGPLGMKRLRAQAEAWGCEPQEAAEMILEGQLLAQRMRGKRR